MKFFLVLLILLSLPNLKALAKPRLLARYSDLDQWNFPEGALAFTSTPAMTEDGNIFLRAHHISGEMLMVKISSHQTFEIIERSKYILSDPQALKNRVSWSHFSESGTHQLSVYETHLTSFPWEKPQYSVDMFQSTDPTYFVMRITGIEGQKELWVEDKKDFFRLDHITSEDYLFPPYLSSNQVVAKVRRKKLSEDGADEIWSWNVGSAPKLLLEDKDANPESGFLTFRHQFAVDGDRVVFIGKEKNQREVIGSVDGETIQIHREGDEIIKEVDYFTPFLRSKNIVVRGLDQKNRATLFSYKNTWEILLQEGDTLMTDKGLAQIGRWQGSTFVGGISGNPDFAVIQAVLISLTDEKTPLGIGVILLPLH